MVQPLASSIEFIPDQGFVLSRGGRSFLLNAASAGQRLTEKQLSAFARATSGFVDAVQGQRPLRFARDQITTGTKSLREPSDTAFVYMDEGKRRFWEQGTIRVSSLATYHRIENEMARDPREGLGLLSIFDEQAQVNLLLRGGNASYVLCGTLAAEKSARAVMRGKFGRHIAKINGLHEFGRRLADLLGAKTFEVRDVMYADNKCYCVPSPSTKAIASILGDKQLAQKSLEMLRDKHFDEIEELASRATIFSKPRHFASERERRVAFHMPSNCASESRTVESKELCRHIEFIE